MSTAADSSDSSSSSTVVSIPRPLPPASPLLTIAVDLDEVLGAFLPGLVEYHNKHYNTDLEFHDYFSYAFSQVWRCSSAEQLRRVHEFALDPNVGLHTMPTIPGALDTLTHFLPHCAFHVVTARSAIFDQVSRDWIAQHFPGIFRSLTCCNEYGPATHRRASKAEICSELGACALIDDSLNNVNSVAKVCAQTLLFDLDGSYQWNSEEQIRARRVMLQPNVKRVKSWNEVKLILEDMIRRKQKEIQLAAENESEDITEAKSGL